MKRIDQLLAEAKSKMNGYIALMALRFSNLCVKADAMSLLSVTVKLDDEELNIEQVANVAIPQDTVLAVMPKSNEFLRAIGQGVMEAHPEFKMDVVQDEDSDDEEDKHLTFTMPEVDKNRHDLLTDGVDGLQKQCKAKLDVVYDYYVAQIALKMVNAQPDQIDEVKNQLKELYDFYNNLNQDLAKQKKDEIDQAYQDYLQAQQEKEKEQQDEDAAHNLEAGLQMVMNGEGDN